MVKLGASEKEIDEINLSIAETEAAENRENILKQFQYFSKNPENIEMQKMLKCFYMPEGKTQFTFNKKKL